MMFTCLQENLEKGLNTVYKAVPTKSSLPILNNILIKTENGRLKLSATNMETAITTFVGASIDKEGSITIPAKLIREFVANLSQNTLSGNLLNEVLHVTSDKTKTKFVGTAVDEYPNLPAFSDKTKHVTVKPKQFLEAVSKVAYSASTDESRPVFTGVYVNYNEGVLTLAASDGFRLSETSLEAKGDVETFTIIVPSKVLLEVARIFGDSTEDLKIGHSENENLTLFFADDTLVSTRIIDGQYPDYKRIVPKESTLSAVFPAMDLLEAVKLSNIFAKEVNNVVKLRIDPEGYINVVTNAQETGDHLSQIQSEVLGESVEIAFNSKYLLDFLNNNKSERIVLKANGSLAPCIFTPEGEITFYHIVMPMQLQ